MPAGATCFDSEDHYYYVLLLDESNQMYFYRMQVNPSRQGGGPWTVTLRYLIPNDYYPALPIATLLFNPAEKRQENPDRGLIATVEDDGVYKILLLDISRAGNDIELVTMAPGQVPVLFSAKYDTINGALLSGACFTTTSIEPLSPLAAVGLNATATGCKLISLDPSSTGIGSTAIADRQYSLPSFQPGIMPYQPVFPAVVPPTTQPVGIEDVPFAVPGVRVSDGDVDGILGMLYQVEVRASRGHVFVAPNTGNESGCPDPTLDPLMGQFCVVDSVRKSNSFVESRQTLSLQGNQSYLNAALASLVYRGESNFYGTDTIDVVIQDASYVDGRYSRNAADIYGITVYNEAVNDAPEVFGPAFIGMDASNVIPLRDIAVMDPDAWDGIQITLESIYGVFRLSESNASAYSRVRLEDQLVSPKVLYTGNHQKKVVFWGRLEDVNQVMYGRGVCITM